MNLHCLSGIDKDTPPPKSSILLSVSLENLFVESVSKSRESETRRLSPLALFPVNKERSSHGEFS